MHIYLRTDVGPRLIACEEVRVCGSGSDLHMPGALRAASADLFGGDGGVGREGGQLQCGSRLKPPLSEGRAAAR